MKKNRKKFYNPHLEKHGGCEGCTKNCPYNNPTAHPDIAKRSKGNKFICNNSIKKEII